MAWLPDRAGAIFLGMGQAAQPILELLCFSALALAAGLLLLLAVPRLRVGDEPLRMRRLLNGVADSGPVFGLLGTVTALARALQEGLQSGADLGPFLGDRFGEALVTTMIGAALAGGVSIFLHTLRFFGAFADHDGSSDSGWGLD